MKNWLYIPFLVLMAITYSRIVDNYNTDGMFNVTMKGRAPASVATEKEVAKKVSPKDEDCLDLTTKHNPHLKKSAKCEL
jgi:hypothetical protein